MQILLVSTLGNVYSTVWRIFILKLGYEGLSYNEWQKSWHPYLLSYIIVSEFTIPSPLPPPALLM